LSGLDKILILSSSNPYKLAGVAAKDLLDSFRNSNRINAKLVTKEWDFYHDKDIISVDSFFSYNIKRVIRKVKTVIRRIGILKTSGRKIDPDYYFFDYDETIKYYSTRGVLNKARLMPDIIIVLFMHNFLTFKNLYELNIITKAPIFLYLPDMVAFTGGCHYAWSCRGYVNSCGNCPALFSDDPFDQTNINWKYKKEIVEKSDFHLVAGSEWAYLQILNSSIFAFKQKHLINTPINEELFRPGNKLEIRKRLGIPLEKKIIFIAAVSFSEKRKGFSLLLEALKILSGKLSEGDKTSINLIVAGRKSKDIINIFPFYYYDLGYLTLN
jgi:glycosyltransferase involved in cell wall biosynthesis